MQHVCFDRMQLSLTRDALSQRYVQKFSSADSCVQLQGFKIGNLEPPAQANEVVHRQHLQGLQRLLWRKLLLKGHGWQNHFFCEPNVS